MKQTHNARLVLPPFQIESNVYVKYMKKFAETRFNKVFVQVKRMEKDLYMDVFEIKRNENKCDKIRKRHGNGRSAPCLAPHCIKMFNILL